MFVGRKREMDTLNRIYVKDSFEFVVITIFSIIRRFKLVVVG